jgi:hypothetical protein
MHVLAAAAGLLAGFPVGFGGMAPEKFLLPAGFQRLQAS